MGLISRVSSRTYRVNLGPKWPFISTESCQTHISASESYGRNSPRPGSTRRPRKWPAVKHEPARPSPSPHDRSLALSAQLSSAPVPIQRQAATRPRFHSGGGQRCRHERQRRQEDRYRRRLPTTKQERRERCHQRCPTQGLQAEGDRAEEG